MNLTLKRALSLVLALMLLFSVAACDKGGDDGDDEGGSLFDTISAKKDPGKYLDAAIKATVSDLESRYSGSPIAALSKLTGTSGAVEFNMSAQQDGESAEIGGTANFDLEAGRLLLDAYIGYMDQRIDASLYGDKDYIGISVPMLTGDQAYYGFVPHDLYDQVSNSIFADMLEEEDLQVLRQLDELMDAMSDVDASSAVKELEDRISKIADDFSKSFELTAEAETITVNGKSQDGWVVSTTVTPDQIADLYSAVLDAVFDLMDSDSLSGIMSTVGDLGELNDSREELESYADELRELDGTIDVLFYIADGSLIRVTLVPSGQSDENCITLDFYENDSVTFTVSAVDEEPAIIQSSVKSGRGSYEHVLTVTSDGQTVTISADWKDNHLSLTAAMDGQTAISLDGEFGVSSDGFYLNDCTLYTDDGSTSQSIDLDLKYTSGGAVTTPMGLNNIFTMDEQDLMGLIMAIASVAGDM